ncbi:EmrA/EmrK family multidrug efflux transporter periplasmic adaptor subunit [Bordetella holmesii]|uniref:Efflux pump membrane protein n=2 Tax=Bordetella holmesii TaxID=35814 RepID=A0A158M6V4_9BORD|nr:EmrA/EmrK family multidrug efflux transporter periplasmic adaptor subunit [Bordetella holmesii]AHV91678.1 efflux transporter, RND family, MFP subunit [Bordetella holmesii ATCC 51541]AIT24719.1 efflux transporter, RND family, MFP subunit [Bordetella holmesii 44057]EWM40235.1 efflux transporter, RND family, MFP subunit [Bordetella holmesii 41130]EWM45285.1 efflux transporter, RND family, MFP subunit [Bordetella holmesii 70147]EWM49399.1 efflux transporter, RND family, MFP subunit [Bordetella 
MNTPTTHPARKRLLLIATGAFIVLALLYGAWWALYGSHFESTDDAYVHGNLVQITPQVPGTVVAIETDDTDMVKAGEPLVRLDPADTDVALQQAEAKLAQIVRQVRTFYVQNDSLAADVDVRQADIGRAQADLNRAQSDLKRRQALAASGGVSGEEILHAETTLKTAQAGLAQARAALASAQAKQVTNQALTQGTSVENHPDVRQAAANLRNAWLASSRTVLPAPVDGMIARRSVQVGQRVAPGSVLMTVVPLDQVWVEANFKEGQLRHMRIGQPVTMTADLYGSSVKYHGKVIGMDAGTGSAFALLPAQNATGNWIKVVQRVPVRIALDPEDLKKHPLRVGLSMDVEVDVGKDDGPALTAARSEPAWSTRAFDAAHGEVDALIAKIIKDNLQS